MFRRHPHSKDLEHAGLFGALCDALGHRAPATGPDETIKVTIKEEALGRYFPRTRTVQLYPRVIEPVAESLGIPADQLTTVVLAHEMAHAVTHLGGDADQMQWPPLTGWSSTSRRSTSSGANWTGSHGSRCGCA